MRLKSREERVLRTESIGKHRKLRELRYIGQKIYTKHRFTCLGAQAESGLVSRAPRAILRAADWIDSSNFGDVL